MGGQINYATTKGLFVNKLRNVKTIMKTGTLPSKIFEEKDELWKGI